MAATRTNGRNRNLDRWSYPYTPTPRQKVAHQTQAQELLYGGAAGGGKSEYLLASHVVLALMVPGSHSLILRRTFPDLQRSLIPRLLERIPLQVARYNVTDRTWYFKNGSSIELSGIERDVDVLRYQSAEYQLISFDELTQFTEYQYRYLISRLRAAGQVRTRMAELGWVPRIQGCANPGGPGHLWVKARFIDPAPPFTVWSPPLEPGQRRALTRVFIPARTDDNPHLNAEYDDYLAGLGDPVLVRALREGDWDILEGVRFTAFRRAVHVISPDTLPIPKGSGVVRGIGVDYGLDAPFSAHWGAKLADNLVVIYRELYAPGLTPREQAEAIRDAERPDEVQGSLVALDPSTWARNPDQARRSMLNADPDAPPAGSIAGTYREVLGRRVVKAWNSRLDGAALWDDHLRVRKDGLPRVLIYDTCVNLIRTLPALPRSLRDPEDVDTNAEDHAYDSSRYLLGLLAGRRVGQPKTDTPGQVGFGVGGDTGGLGGF